MKVKVGDTVRVLAGKDKGKEGKILMTLKNKDKVVVEGINIVKKHQKPRYTNESGSIVEVEAPIHVSNVKKIEDNKKTKAAKVEKAEKAEKKETAVKTVKETKTTKTEKTTKTTTKKASTSRKKKES